MREQKEHETGGREMSGQDRLVSLPEWDMELPEWEVRQMDWDIPLPEWKLEVQAWDEELTEWDRNQPEWKLDSEWQISPVVEKPSVKAESLNKWGLYGNYSEINHYSISKDLGYLRGK